MQIQKNTSLKSFNSFGIEASSKLFASFTSTDELGEILTSKQAKSNKLLPLGGGSNLLLTQNFDGLTLKNEIKGINLIKEDEHHYFIEVGAGENWHQFVLKSLSNNWFGAENLSLIPGSVGASPMQNIGAYGIELKEVLWFVEAMEIATQKIHRFEKDDCEFGYRTSIFKTKIKGETIITKVGFKLNKKANLNTSYGAIQQELETLGIVNPTPKDVSQAVINIRSSKLPNPAEIGNAGSFFKNPVVSKSVYEEILKVYPSTPSYPVSETEVKVPAGWLIETAGWKGKTIDNRFGVHKKQALVLVNYKGATGKEIYDLSENILTDIKAKFGVELEREVNII